MIVISNGRGEEQGEIRIHYNPLEDYDEEES